jgi:hypothetical protein
VRPAGRTKGPKKGVVWFFTKEAKNRSFILENFVWQTINEKDSSKKGLVPKFKRHGGMSKKGEANFDNVSMFTFCGSILLVSMRTRYVMCYPYLLEK